MAIKEFIIGPQNYFEQGYFDGDYTYPNVSKSFLECDVDNFKGGRVVTGEYFQDNYIDGTYWHNNSMKFEMQVDAIIVQEATVGLQGYYQEGYFASGYSEQRGSFFVLSAELTRTGEDVFATGTWTSSVTLDITVSKTVSAESSLSVEFTQTAYGARQRDIDLFAFSEGQLSSLVQALREYNLTAESAFDIATDYIRYRDTSADADAEFSQVVNNQRSRAFQSETQAAFSFALSYENYRPFQAGIESQSSLDCTISHIHGADISVDNFATLTASLENVTKETSVELTSQSTIYANGGFTFTDSANLRAYSSLFVSRNIAESRPRNLPITVNANSYYDATTKKFGTHSWHPAQDFFTPTTVPKFSVANGDSFVVEGWVYLDNTTNAYVNITAGPASIRVAKSSVKFAAGITDINGSVAINYEEFTTAPTTNAWNHFAIVSNGSRVSWYIRGIRVYTSTALPSTYYKNSISIYNYAGGIWIDELSFWKGTTLGFDPSATSLTVPSTARTNSEYTQALWHFNNNGLDDYTAIPITHSGIASLSSTVSVSATLSGPIQLAASITSTSTLTATISHIEGADIVVDGFATVSASVDKLKNAESNSSSEFTVSTDGNAIRDAVSSQNSEITVSATGLRIQEGLAAFESVASQLTATVRLAGLFADDLSQFNLNVDAVVVRVASSTISSEFAFSLNPLRIQSSSVDFNSEFTTEVSGITTINAAADISAEYEVLTAADRIRFADSNQTSSFTLSANATNLGKIESSLFNTASMSVDAVKITGITKLLESETSLSATTNNSLTKGGIIETPIITAELTLTISKIVYGVIITESVASELVAVVKQAVADVEMNVVASLSAAVKKTAGISASISATSTLSATALRIRKSAVSLSSQSSLTAIGLKQVVQGAAVLQVAAAELIVIAKTSGNSADLAVTSTVSASISIIKRSAISANAAFTQTTSALRKLSLSSSQIVTASVSVIPTVVIEGEASISSAMTFTAGVREIFIEEIIYVIPGEIWEFDIPEETREYTIGSETREYIIT